MVYVKMASQHFSEGPDENYTKRKNHGQFPTYVSNVSPNKMQKCWPLPGTVTMSQNCSAEWYSIRIVNVGSPCTF
jgi:hypothetical protein